MGDVHRTLHDMREVVDLAEVRNGPAWHIAEGVERVENPPEVDGDVHRREDPERDRGAQHRPVRGLRPALVNEDVQTCDERHAEYPCLACQGGEEETKGRLVCMHEHVQ